MQDSPDAPSVSMTVVYEDEHLIEIDTRVDLGQWSGAARAYTTRDVAIELANAIKAWSIRPEGECSLVIGGGDGLGAAALRFRTVDNAGHVVCRVELAAPNPRFDCRPEHTWRLSAEMATEPGLIERFAERLKVVMETSEGDAVLQGVRWSRSGG